MTLSPEGARLRAILDELESASDFAKIFRAVTLAEIHDAPPETFIAEPQPFALTPPPPPQEEPKRAPKPKAPAPRQQPLDLD